MHRIPSDSVVATVAIASCYGWFVVQISVGDFYTYTTGHAQTIQMCTEWRLYPTNCFERQVRKPIRCTECLSMNRYASQLGVEVLPTGI